LRAAFRLRRGDLHLDVEVDLPAAGLTAIFGPSGAGKTSCLRVLAGLDRAEGEVRLGNEVWQDDARGIFVPTHERPLGYVFQDARLFPHLSVRKNLDYGRARRAGPGGTTTFDEMVERMGLGSLLERRPAHLSGGEQRRVAIARALLAGPRLVLMDEPLASLDVAFRTDLLPYLERLRDGASVPIVYVTHSLDEVCRLADHLVLLESGRVKASAPTAAALARLDLPTAVFDDAGVVLMTRVVAHDDRDELTCVAFEGGSLWLARSNRPVGASVRVRVLARDVSLACEPPGSSSILNVLRVRVEETSDHGPDRVNVRLSTGDGGPSLLARVTRRSRDALGLVPGAAVYAMVKSVALT
jgi:molybdate transport system ATP-binding protein